jgi:hypothetical protein
MYFLMFVILAWTEARFLANALHVWESMVLGLARKEPTYRFMCCYDPRFSLCTLATVLLRSCLPLCSRCRLLLCCVAIFLLEVVLLTILNVIDANPQSGLGGPCMKVHKVDCIWFKSLDCGVTWALLNTHNALLPATLFTWLPTLNCYCQHDSHCPSDNTGAGSS